MSSKTGFVLGSTGKLIEVRHIPQLDVSKYVYEHFENNPGKPKIKIPKINPNELTRIRNIIKGTTEAHNNPTMKILGAPTVISYSSAYFKHVAWCSNPGFRAVVAAVDMFFHRFQVHEWSAIKQATTGSRHRDCAAILSIHDACKLLGLPHPTQLWEWVIVESLHKKFERLLGSNDEYDKPYSYFPYQMDFGLTPKSAYSARANPEIHTFCHIIGVYAQNPPSLLAKFHAEYDVDKITFNAHFVGFVFTHQKFLRPIVADVKETRTEWERIQAAPKAQETAEQGTLSTEDLAGTLKLDLTGETTSRGREYMPPPKSFNRMEWIQYLKFYKWSMSEDMIKVAKGISRGIKEAREGSIGARLKNQIYHTTT